MGIARGVKNWSENSPAGVVFVRCDVPVLTNDPLVEGTTGPDIEVQFWLGRLLGGLLKLAIKFLRAPLELTGEVNRSCADGMEGDVGELTTAW